MPWIALGSGAAATAAFLVRVAAPGWLVLGPVDPLLLLATGLAGVALVAGYRTSHRVPAAPLGLDEDTYRALFVLNPQPMFVVDHAGTRFLDANEAAVDLYGYGRAELLEMGPADIRPAEEIERFQSHIESLSGGLQRHGLWRHQRKNGSVLFVEPVTHDMEYEGELARLVLVNDVTGRYTAEKALQVTGSALEAIVDASPLAIIVLDEDDRVQVWNAAAERMFGWTADEVIGARSPLIVAETAAEFDGIISRILGGEHIQGLQIRRRRKDGRWIDLSLATSAVPATAGDASWRIGIFEDITEQLAIQEALRFSEVRYRELLEQASDGILLLDDTGRLYGVNSTICEMLGYTREEILTLNVEELVAPESLAERPLRFPELRDGKTTVTPRALLKKDGTRLPVEISARMTTDGQIHAIVRDITERQRLEAQLRQSQKMEAVGRLAGGIAHDFNNILTAISGYTRMIAEELDADDPLSDDLRQIVANTERASDLTRQLLAFSRKQVVQPKVLDLNAVIRDLGKLIRRLVGEDIRLVEELADGIGSVRMDPSEIEQVIMNLVVNARDVMPGGGTVRIETGEATLAGRSEDGVVIPVRPGRHVYLAVTDTGTGMDEATMGTIFEPFFTTKEPGKGTGLGLSTVYGIMEQAGGSVAVESGLGRGTTFTVYFPRVDGRPARQRRQVSAGASEAAGVETVLLVEDEEAVRSLASRILRRHGYTVIEASDAPGALGAVSGHAGTIDLLLTDVIMPGASGPELAERLRRDRPELRVLYMSGYMADEVGRAGVIEDSGFLQKPFTPNTLASKVRETLDG